MKLHTTDVIAGLYGAIIREIRSLPRDEQAHVLDHLEEAISEASQIADKHVSDDFESLVPRDEIEALREQTKSANFALVPQPKAARPQHYENTSRLRAEAASLAALKFRYRNTCPVCDGERKIGGFGGVACPVEHCKQDASGHYHDSSPQTTVKFLLNWTGYTK